MKKPLLALGIISIVFSLSSTVDAQELQFGVPVTQEIKITISTNGDAHVIHEIDKSNASKQVKFISNDYTNLQVTDKSGKSIQHAQANAENVSLIIFPTNEDVIVEYDVVDMAKENSGMWTLSYSYLASTAFYLPENVRLIYINDNLLNLGDKDGIKCHGCKAEIEYELIPTETTKQVKWQNKNFDIKIITQTEIVSLQLDQPNKKISFDVKEKDKHITLIIPKELLWNPYEVILNEEQIRKQEYSDGNNVWLHIKPNETGTVEIIGVSVVPEFPIAVILVLSVAMIVAIYANKSISLR